MGFDKRSAAKSYTPQDGDTLQSIAERETAAGNPLTAEELARFNWGTDDPATLDELLRDELGCYKRGEDNHFVVTADVQPRSALLIPVRFSKPGLATDTDHTITVKKTPAPPEQFKACAQIEGVTFEFDSSFIRPTVMESLKTLEAERSKNPDTKVLVYGHTDKVGSETYNKDLSERRARSVYAFITNQPAIWEDLYQRENWGIRVVQIILDDLEYAPGPADGVQGPQTTAAIKHFQKNSGLTDDGIAGPTTREALFDTYMSGKHDVAIEDGDFMDPKHMGCGEFNPVVETETACEANRRVTFYLFNEARLPAVPCKHGDLGPCRQQTEAPLPRHKDSFHCSFYDSIACRCKAENPSGPPPVVEKGLTLKGKLFWNRTWDYNDDTTPIAAVKEFLPGARVELRTGNSSTLTVHQSVFLTDDGEFTYTDVPAAQKAALRIFLEHKDGKKVRTKGMSNDVAEADFEVKKDQIVWHQLEIEAGELDGTKKTVDLGDVEITKDYFVDLCDAYHTVWLGHERIVELASHDLPICQINVPEPGVSNASDEMQINKQDLKDRDVILHEYGHFIGTKVLNGLAFPGYLYNDDPAPGSHFRDTKEHYESSWNEGHATFLSCAIQDDPHYHDGYDTTIDFQLDSDNTQVGPHAEGSIQEALWRLYKVHGTDFKAGFWKAFTDQSVSKAETIYAFYDNWKGLGLADLDKLIEAYKKFNMEFGYRYKEGGDRFTCVAAPKSFDEAKKEFRTVQELFDNFGTLGSGTIADYREEFYNRNKDLNANSLAAGSSKSDPKVTTGKKYIVPVRFQVTE